ncbi:MAG: LamG-like jellyroll fold domain-containing protein [Alloprevotella sp.]
MKKARFHKMSSRWGKTIALLLLALLPFNRAVHAIDLNQLSHPIICDEKGYNEDDGTGLPGRAHLKFTLKYFNYDGDNSGFEGDVYLTLQYDQLFDLDVATLSEAWDSITDIRKKEGIIKDKSYPRKLGSVEFNYLGYVGVVVLSNSRKVSDKWIALDVDLILSEMPFNRETFRVGVRGNWVRKDGKETERDFVYTTFGAASFDIPQIESPKYVGKGKVELPLSGFANEQFNHSNGKQDVKGDWIYGLRFAYNHHNSFPSNDALYSILTYTDDTMTGATAMNGKYKETAAKTTKATVTLKVDNYKAQQVYPIVSHVAKNYTLFPNNQYNSPVTKDVNLRYFYSKPTYINGHPRPNPAGGGDNSSKADKAMHAYPDPWKKNMTISWYPEIYDTRYVNTEGKWIVFRDGTKVGEVKYSTNKDKKTTFIDDIGLEYDKPYTYTVAFQPDSWGELEDADYASELSCSVKATMSRLSPFKSLTASNDISDKVNITCEFQCFTPPPANDNDGYTIVLQRRINKDGEDWDKNYATYKVEDISEKEHTFTDTNVKNKCTTYQYRAIMKAQDTTFVSQITRGCITGATNLLSIKASRGTYKGKVNVQWSVDQIGEEEAEFSLQRRKLGSTNESDFKEIYTTSGNKSIYNYTDETAQSGSYYEYRVKLKRTCETEKNVEGAFIQTDGFSMATGVISGCVTYGTGTAVAGVKVSLDRNSTEETWQSAHAMRVNGKASCIMLDKTEKAEEFVSLFTKPWTMQMYLKPDALQSNATFFSTNFMDMQFATDSTISVNLKTNGTTKADTIKFKKCRIEPNCFHHITLSYNSAHSYTLRVVNEDGEMSEDTLIVNAIKDYTKAQDDTVTTRFIAFGNQATTISHGVIDECRIWSKALTKEEVTNNYFRILSGSEDKLYLYYKLDEGIENQKMAYDYSKTAGVANENHGTISSMMMTDEVPGESLLSVCGVTDSVGNYTISGVPFSGDGTTYSICPTLGVHSFSPARATRFVSGSSLVYSGVDFTDESSFEVSGTVRFFDTTIPVEGCELYIDGKIATKNGEVVKTDSKGDYLVSVPIGRHYLEVKKNGHTFVSRGRFPADPKGVGTTEVFDRKRSLVDFYDSTLVNFTGRIVGGSVQADTLLGFHKSKNNIGITELTLIYQGADYLNARTIKNGTSIAYDRDNVIAPVASQTDSIRSHAYRGANDDCQKVFITTDSLTGEFSAMLPPLIYKLESVLFVNPKNKYYSKTSILDTKPFIDLSDATISKADTLKISPNKEILYPYHTALKEAMHTTAVFNVQQRDTPEGVFGADSCKVSDPNDPFKVALYDYDETKKKVTYHFGAPIFESLSNYTFDISAYEHYVNTDLVDENGVHPTDTVRLSGIPITISNALSAEQLVVFDESSGQEAGSVPNVKVLEAELDSLGNCIYKWKAGLPNITSPYKRAIKIYYDIDGATNEWYLTKEDGSLQSSAGISGIILGTLTTGSNFVTQGPDLIDMVLRDPPGTYSSASWTKGTYTSYCESSGDVWSSESAAGTLILGGYEQKLIFGNFAAGVETTVTSKNDDEYKAYYTVQGEDATSWTTSLTIEEKISTSSDPKLVGNKGDLFIGTSTNLIFGKSSNLGLYRTEPGKETVELRVDTVTEANLKYETGFHHTASYIERTLIPNLRALRNSLLITVDEAKYKNYANNTNKPVYITKLSKDSLMFGSDNDDERWGDKAKTSSSEGPSYKMVMPANASPDSVAVDMVMFYNSSINNWLRHLATNEKHKVNAYENRATYLIRNISFDGGATVTETQTTDTTKTDSYTNTFIAGARLNISKGAKVNEAGIILNFETKTGGGLHQAHSSTEKETTTFSYTLQDNIGDALTVDVYEYDKWGPIFRTRGGQTSQPYEDQVLARFYEPEAKHIIMDKTMQIEVPSITVDTVKWAKAYNVPTGGTANYTLQLDNDSEIERDIYYKLIVADETNPNGAIVSMEGLPITGEGRIIKIPAKTTVHKTLQLQQTDQSILDYDNIAIILASQTQCDPTGLWAVIADTAYISAEFVPSSSDVRMKLDKNIINSVNHDDVNITFDQFDRNYRNLKCFRVQVMTPGDADWMTLQEYMLNESEVKNNKVLLPNESSVTYHFDMHNQSDGEYRFRVLSVSQYGEDEITVSSNEIAIVKDMAKPKPLGMPQPSNGILGIGDDICLTFNEEIVKGALTRDNNFEVTAVLNGAQVAHHTALAMQGATRTASTEAPISLAGKSFSTDCWLLVESKGTILTHGNGKEKFALAVDDDDHLVVTIGEHEYVSEQVMPKDNWCYLTVSFEDRDSLSILNATVSEDATSTRLFKDCETVTYKGVGSLSIGEGMNGAIQELTLWDVAHDNARAQQERQKTKSPATANLMGYWKMNEGEGLVITDYARNRHLTAASESWYINNENKAVTLDGTGWLNVPVGDLAVSETDNQALEFWFKADKQKRAQLLDWGHLSLWLDEDGKLKFNPDTTGVVHNVSSRDLTDNKWHHLALNILRAGNTSVYVDGQRAFSIASRNVDYQNDDTLVIGARFFMDESHSHPLKDSIDCHLTGMIDEVRIWNATLDATSLANNRKLRLTGKESGLVAYFPFEHVTISETDHQVKTLPCDSSLVDDGVLRVITHAQSPLTFTEQSPALQPMPTLSNVAFSFTTSDDKVVIQVEEEPAAIEGCTIHFTVKNVTDQNGNWSDPVCWTAYVNRNSLAWSENEISLTQKAGEESFFLATLNNKGGTQKEWRLTGIPSWLKVSQDNGILDPLSSANVEFTVSKSCPIGKHAETLYLIDEDDLALPLALNITVTGDVPDWQVEDGKYATSMNLVGKIAVHDIPSNDTDDMVGAFVNGTCRGVAKPTYSKRYDDYFFTLDIACNGEENGSDVEFRIYDASTGITWPVVELSREVKISANAVVGSFTDPVLLNAFDMIQQNLSLSKGWNWISFYTRTGDMLTQEMLEPIGTNATVIKNKTSMAMLNGETWDGSLNKLNNRDMFRIFMLEPQQMTIMGTRPDALQKTITIHKGWNWIAFNETTITSVSDAFAALAPEEGDLVKSKQGFAIFDGYEWSGSLQALMPGEGYMYKSCATVTRTFTYPTLLAQSVRLNAPMLQRSGVFEPVDDSDFPGNMTVVARATFDDALLTDTEVGVFCGEECRTADFTNSNGIIYLTIPGNTGDELTFFISRDGSLQKADITLIYEDDKIVGTPSSPFALAFGANNSNSGIETVKTDEKEERWYTVSGILLSDKPTMPGVYYRHIRGDKRKGEKVVIK